MSKPQHRIRRQWVSWLPLVVVVVVTLLVVPRLIGGRSGDDETASVTTTTLTAATSMAPVTTTAPATTTIPTTTTTTLQVVPASPSLGGTVVVGMIGESGSLNPFAERTPLAEAAGRLTWASAVLLEGDGLNLVPGVLADLPSKANGGFVFRDDGSVVITLRISGEAYWEDGTPISGADLAFTAAALASDRRLTSAVRQRYGRIDLDEATVGPRTFRFVLDAPTIDVWQLFDVIMPAHVLRDADILAGWDEMPWPSAGPFRVATADVDRVVLEANPGWRGQTPALDALEIATYADGELLAEAAAQGLVDIAHIGGGAEAGAVAERTGGQVVSRPGEEWEHVAFQFGESRFSANPRSLTASPTYRQLLVGLLDADEMVAEIEGAFLLPSHTMVGASWPSGAWRPTEGVPDAPVDISDDWVGRIAADLGTTPGEQPLVRYSTTNSLERTQLAGIILRKLAGAGISVDISLEDPGLLFRDLVIPGEFDLAEWAWTATPGPVGAVRDVQSRLGSAPERGGLNFYRWGAPGAIETNEGSNELFAQIDALDTIMDLDELAVVLRRIDRIVLSDAVVIPLWQTLDHAVVTGTVTGYRHPRFGVPVTWQAVEWSTSG
ncbi:MAG: ABC transporter substrate-binding protein [Acidimicrobiia bacterium]|nr:ABC transporter substrate-binding protein [Acidimicrobiia bacterium]